MNDDGLGRSRVPRPFALVVRANSEGALDPPRRWMSVAREGRHEGRRYFFFAAFFAPPLLPRFSARSIFPSQASAAARAFFLLP
jgi:hypothetical protein